MIKTVLLLFYNFVRIVYLILFSPRRFRIHFVQRISPLCSLKAFDQGRLSIGKNCEFSAYCDLEVHGKGLLSIGAKTYMNRYCMISSHEEVFIGNGCMFGPGVKVFDNDHIHTPEDGVSYKLKTAPIHIGNHCWIASDVIVLKGTTIGDNCVIGAGCIVKGNIPSGTVMKGTLSQYK